MASFQDSVKASKEAGQANSEILDIMSESVDGKLNGSFSIPKNDANSYKFRYEHPKEIEITNVETPSIHKRKAGAFSGEKQSRNNKSQRQGSSGLHVEREEVPFDNPFNQTVSPFTICLNKFCFSTNMDEESELAEKVFNRDFPELSKRSPKMFQNQQKTYLS